MIDLEELERDLNMLQNQASPLIALDPDKYEPMGWDESIGRWIVKSKSGNRYYSLPGTEGEIYWSNAGKPIKFTNVKDQFKQGEINLSGIVNVIKQPKKKKEKSMMDIDPGYNPNYLPITKYWGSESYTTVSVDYNEFSLPEIVKRYTGGKDSVTDLLLGYLTSKTSIKSYSGSQSSISMMNGKINYYYNPNSKTWRMGIQDGPTVNLRGSDVPVEVWNKAGLVKPEKDIKASFGVQSLEEFNKLVVDEDRPYQTYMDARNFGLDLPFDKQEANWFKVEDQAFTSPSGNTYIKDSVGGYIVSGNKITEMYGKNTMYINPEYTPVEFESDMNKRSGWVAPSASGVNAWVNKHGQMSTVDPAQIKVEDWYKNQEAKKRKSKGSN